MNNAATFGPPKTADVDSMLRLLSGPEATRKVVAKESTDKEGVPDSGGLDALSRSKKGSGGKPGKKVSSVTRWHGTARPRHHLITTSHPCLLTTSA